MNPPLSSWLRSNNVVLTSYGRTALYLALVAIDVRRKEVMIPAFTCATTLQPAILQAGGVPVFVDICNDTLNLDLGSLRDQLSPRVRAVISHHYYGSTASNIEDVQRFATEHRLIHIEDCAHSLGARCERYEVGQTGDVAVFSFSKLLNCPGGGAVSFKDRSLFERAHDLQRRWANRFHEIVTDTDALRYESELIKDRPGSLDMGAAREPMARSLFVRRLLKKAVCDCGLYRSGVFRAMSPADVCMFRPGLDTRMTRLQNSRISRMMEFLDGVIRERRRKARIFNEIVPAYFNDFEANVLTNYVTMHSKAEDLALSLRTLGWPYFQKYWPAQMTSSVRKLRDQLLLVDVDSINEEIIDTLRHQQAVTATGNPVHAQQRT